jgi:hemoglobin/transferrin/lactoferrin receptor protein
VTSFPQTSRAIVAAILFPAVLLSQSPPVSGDSVNGAPTRSTSLKAVTVTATRTATDVRNVAAPVLVIDSLRIRSQLSNGVSDLLRTEPGVDVVGTGANQVRPAIRGQRGQRILLLEDGMRLNNTRRQQDFGEITSLVDADQLARVEVVRGPASVLYGTDAIGGVVNLITRAPGISRAEKLSGRVTYQYGGAGTLGKTSAALGGRAGNWAFDLSGSARVVGDYDAPAGTYGKVKLANSTTLLHSGVRDQNVAGSLAWRPTASVDLFAKFERYAAADAGFGYVPPTLIGGDQTQIEIRYPKQEFGKFSTGVHAGALGSSVMDKLDITAYRQKNTRELAQHIFAFFGPGTPPGAGVDISTANFTDITSTGFRAEASKVLDRAIVTYGLDLFSDNSINTDSSKTTVVGFGPPRPTYSGRPQVPNATLTSYGAFAQADFRLHERFSFIVGGRSQHVESSPKVTAGRTDVIASHSDGTTVYAANAVWRLTDNTSFVATVGRGFRSPNLVERYFEGPTPEGSAYQKAAPDLRAETSLNVDGGLKYRNDWLTAEASLFQNDIHDAIVIAATGASQGRLPVYTNVNVGRLRSKGGEVSATALLGAGFTGGANYSTVKSTNVAQANVPVGDTYAGKLNVSLGWTNHSGRFWTEYAVRRNGEQKDIAVTASPVGPVLPAFTVQSARAGIRGWSVGSFRQDLTIGVNNLTNALYTETANASFFRPEPGRHLVLALSTTF